MRVAGWLGVSMMLMSGASARAEGVPSYVIEARGEALGGRMFAAVASDPWSRRALSFGGLTSGGELGETLEWDGFGWQRRLPSTSPSIRFGAGMAFDSKRRRHLLFGGGRLSDTSTFVPTDARLWEWAAGDWRELPVTESPPARGMPALTAHPETGELWMFGGAGADQGGALDDFYRFDGRRWHKIERAGSWPSARAASGLAFDPASGQLVLFGGVQGFRISLGIFSAGSTLSDTWVWDGQAWSERSRGPEAPEPPLGASQGFVFPTRGLTSLVRDPEQKQLWLVDEALEGVMLWRWDGEGSWSRETPRPTQFEELQTRPVRSWPSPNMRLYGNVFWDYARGDLHHTGGLATYAAPGANLVNLIELFTSGFNVVDGAMANDDWAFRQGQWTRWHPAGAPSPRDGAAAAVHERLGVAVMHGGRMGQSTPLGDTWIWDSGRWFEATALDASVGEAPSPRRFAAMAYDAGRRAPGASEPGSIVLFGGFGDASLPLGDTWVWSDGWKPLELEGDAPPWRSEHVLLSVPGGVVIHGGIGLGGERLYDTWLLGSTATGWLQLPIDRFAGCESNSAHQCGIETAGRCNTYLDGVSYLYGGELGGGSLLGVFERFDRGEFFSIETDQSGPERRARCSLTSDFRYHELLLMGGGGLGATRSNWFRYDLEAELWQSFLPESYDAVGTRPSRLVGANGFFDPKSRSSYWFGGMRLDRGTLNGETWRLRRLGDGCEDDAGCQDGLSCVDGVCCESSACGPCESCATEGRHGVCAPRGEAGSVPGCAVDEGLSCNGDGRCRASEGQSCERGAECASGSCLAGLCCPIEGCPKSCLDDRTQRSEDGSQRDCGAYLCRDGCLTSCVSVEDCASGYVCSPTQECVPITDAVSDDGGCACRGAPLRAAAAPTALMTLLALLARRRGRGR